MEIEIDEDIYSVLEARAEEKEFDKTDKYITHLLEQVVEKIRKEKTESQDSYTDEQEKEVKKRLEDLGYTG